MKTNTFKAFILFVYILSFQAYSGGRNVVVDLEGLLHKMTVKTSLINFKIFVKYYIYNYAHYFLKKHYMKTIIQITLIVVATLMISCKSTQQVPFSKVEVTKGDFIKVNASDYPDAKAVMISEEVDFRREGVRQSIWQGENYKDLFVWQTTVIDKVLFLSDNADLDANIDYYYPEAFRYNPLVKCDMWLYGLNDKGSITSRKLQKSEFITNRVNDSTSSVELHIDEPLKGKILMRKYILHSPFYTQSEAQAPIEPFDVNPTQSKGQTALESFDNYIRKEMVSIQSYILQRNIPIVSLTHQLLLPIDIINRYKLIKLGEEDVSIEHSEVNVPFGAYVNNLYQNDYSGVMSREGGTTYEWYSYTGSPSRGTTGFRPTYKADKFVVTAKNLKPLSQNSDEELVGIEFVNLFNEFIEREK